MANTYCKGCAFAKHNESLDKSCEFDIPYHIKDIKHIEKKDSYIYIHDYKCKYAFSEKIISDNNLEKDQIKNFLINKCHPNYYMIVDARHVFRAKDFIDLTDNILSLDIAPKLLSIIIDINKTNNKDIYQTIYQKIEKKIKWKLHAFLTEINFNEAANIAAETNIQNSECSLIYFWNSFESNIEKTNDRINHIFFVRNIQQNNIMGFKSSGFDGLCMPISLYKSVITLLDRDILTAIDLNKELVLDTYE